MERRLESVKSRDLRLAGGVVVFAAYMGLVFFWVLQQPGGAIGARLVGLAHVLPAFAAAIVCLRLASRRLQPSLWGTLGWGLLGVGSLTFAAAEAAATYDGLVARLPTAFPAFADFAYLSSYPCLFAGFIALGFARGEAIRPRALVDSAISLGAVCALSWYYVLKPLSASWPFGIAAVRVALPVVDLGMLFASLVLTRGPLPISRSLGLRFLGASAGCIALTDTLYAYMTLQGRIVGSGILDIGWACGFALLGLASLELRRSDAAATEEAVFDVPPEPPQATAWSVWATLRIVAPLMATAGAALLMIWSDHRPGHAVSFDVIGVSFALVVLTMGRQGFALVEHGQIHTNLHIFNHRLEEKVRERTQQLQTLREIARAANSSLRVEEVLAQVLQCIAGALRAEAVAVWLADDRDESADLQLCGQIGFDLSQHASPLEAVPARWSNGLKDVLMDRHSLPIPFLTPDGARNTNGTAPECLCAVIQWQGKALGVLGAVRWQLRFGETERHLIEAVALEVASALQNAHLYDLAVRAADRDGVTNLLNHRAVVQRLDAECQRAQRTGEPMAVMLLDLNNFKLFNDTHGHLIGDQVLKTTAALLVSSTRSTDIVGRYGGDEFIIICPATPGTGSRELAARIHGRLSEADVQGPRGERLPISASIGVAVYPDGTGSQHELLALADMNMYEAKARGGPAIVGCENNEEERSDFAGGFSTMDALVTAVDRRDHYTRRHSEDVTAYSLMIGQELGLSKDTLRTLRLAGLLHDLGKIAIPDSILRKPGALTDEEYAEMKKHPVYGWLIVGAIPGLNETLPAIRHHHERFDGRGYPDGLAGQEIPLLGRLMAVADAFSAMTTDRPYRKGMERAQAVDQLQQGCGTQFDPDMVAAFLAALQKNPA